MPTSKLEIRTRKADETAENGSGSVERALSVLEAVADRVTGVSNAELHRKLKIPKSSASYILRALVKHGYLRRDRETNRYHLGLKVVGLSHRALAALDVREVSEPVLRQLIALMATRSRYAEDRLTESFSQYVVLGAGLDSFAWRRPDLLRPLVPTLLEEFQKLQVNLASRLHGAGGDLQTLFRRFLWRRLCFNRARSRCCAVGGCDR